MDQRVPVRQGIEFDSLSDDALIKIAEAIKARVTPGSRSTTYRSIKSGRYPQAIKLIGNTSLLRVGHIREWLRDPAGYKQNKKITKSGR